MKHMKKIVIGILVVLMGLTSALSLVACKGNGIADGTYKITEINYDGQSYNLADGIDDIKAQIEENAEDPMVALAIGVMYLMFEGFEMKVSGTDLTISIKIDLLDIDESYTFKYSLNGKNITITGGDAEDMIEEYGKFTYENNKIVITTNEDGIEAGFVFVKQ